MMHPRLTPSNGRVAHQSLQGRVTAERFTEGRISQVTADLAGVFRAPGGGLDCQILYGARFCVLEADPDTGFSFGQVVRDGYVGYVKTTCLGPQVQNTHRVSAIATHVYQRPDMKSGALCSLPFLAELGAAPAENGFFAAGGGFVPQQHLQPLKDLAFDFVSVLERFSGIPYLWGGNSTRGMDCSGAVQLALSAAGVSCPRDADMQQTALGTPLPEGAPVKRGDIVFWRGHVGVMRDATTIIHANATHMAVTSEPLSDVAGRSVAAGDGPVVSIRRL